MYSNTAVFRYYLLPHVAQVGVCRFDCGRVFTFRYVGNRPTQVEHQPYRLGPVLLGVSPLTVAHDTIPVL